MNDQDIAKLVEQKVAEQLATQEARAMTIIASKGTLDWAYPVLILASTAAAMDLETSIFFTFYGLDILNKKKINSLKVPPIANPAMPVPMPNILGMLPGMTAMATMMMNSWMKKANVPSLKELLDLCIEADVKMIACQMTMDVMGVKREDLIDECDVGGAASYLAEAAKAQINLFV